MLKKSKFLYFLLVILLSSAAVFLSLGYKEAKLPSSFLPKIPSALINNLTLTSEQLQVSNRNYSLKVDAEGKVNIMAANGQTIVSGISYFGALENNKQIWGLKNISVQKLNDSTINIRGYGSNNSIVNISFITNNLLPEIKVRINTLYQEATVINQEALVVDFSQPLSKVYLKNRKIDSTNFEPEYWLQQEGVRFGANETSALVYHTPDVSSLQLNTDNSLLFVNLDYYKDHPYVKMVDEKVSDRNWIDLSNSNYSQGMQRSNSFTITIGNISLVIPRLMLVPYGYEAGYVFTEHADGGNIRTQRAAYFGSEDIANANEATGGFVENKIPVTKSVFYSGPEDSLGEAIKEKNHDTLLLHFLDQIYKTGMYDLCLHTPENSNSNSENLDEAIRFMKTRYNTVSWIDHGFYTGDNKEVSVAEGFNVGSKYFAAGFWEKYQTRYFWSPAVELINEKNKVSVTDEIFKLNFYKAYVSLWQHYISTKDLKKLSFMKSVKLLAERQDNKFELDNLRSEMDNALPTPLFWQHPTRTQLVYSWSTYTVNHYDDLSFEEIRQDEKKVTNLIDNRGVFIDHTYCVRDVGPNNVVIQKDGKLIINPYFNKYLKYLGEKRDQGKLCLTTIKDLMDYWISLKNVSFRYLNNNEIKIFNHNSKPIKGLSLVVNSDKVLINGTVPFMKHTGGETIFWFDIPANGEKTLVLE